MVVMKLLKEAHATGSQEASLHDRYGSNVDYLD